MSTFSFYREHSARHLTSDYFLRFDATTRISQYGNIWQGNSRPTSRLRFRWCLPLSRCFVFWPILLRLFFSRLSLGFLLTLFRSGGSHWSTRIGFAFRTEPFAVWHGGQRRFEAFQMIWVVALFQADTR